MFQENELRPASGRQRASGGGALFMPRRRPISTRIHVLEGDLGPGAYALLSRLEGIGPGEPEDEFSDGAGEDDEFSADEFDDADDELASDGDDFEDDQD